MRQPPCSHSHTDSILWALPFGQLEWELTPPAVQDYITTQNQQIAQFQTQIAQLQQQVEPLQGRVDKTSQTSRKPPSSDSPFNKPKRQRKTSSGQRSGQPGHRGKGPTLLRPTEVHLIEPGPCPCGHGNLVSLTPSYTQQVIELPPIEMEVHPFILQPGLCPGCGRQLKAQVPRDSQAGYGPRLSALIAALAGMHRTSWRLIQDCCHSVFTIPLSLGAVQKVSQRVSQALVPHHEAIATLAHQAPVGSMDATPWSCQNALPWLWIMATDKVASYRIAPHRSKDAFLALIEAWQGIVVSDGYGVSQDWVHQRQTCLAHLIRSARSLSQRRDPDIAACGHTALKALQRLCHMAHEPPSGGQWQAWYARFCRLLDRDQERADDAGRLVRRLAREMASLWVFLRAHGVDPPTTSPNEAYDLASCGARPLTAPTVTPAIVGWSVPYRCAKPVASWAKRPLASWSMRSPASSKVVNPTSPGFIENLSTLLHSPCSRVQCELTCQNENTSVEGMCVRLRGEIRRGCFPFDSIPITFPLGFDFCGIHASPLDQNLLHCTGVFPYTTPSVPVLHNPFSAKHITILARASAEVGSPISPRDPL